jgi:gliding motility-associated-like protein
MEQRNGIAVFLITAVFFLLSIQALAQKPSISSVDKFIAGNNEIVTIQGTNFGANAANIRVYFGAVRGTINFISDQLIEVKVPAGTTYNKISITNIAAGLTEYSTTNFLLSYGGPHGFTATQLQGQKDFNAESGLYDLCMCDLDSDGKSDIATANDNANFVTILQNTTASPGLAPIAYTKIPFLLNTRSLHSSCGDLNGDGRPDLVFSEAGATGDRIFIFQNTSAGPGSITFSLQSIRLTGKKVKQVKIADLDLDGKPELVVSNQGANNLTILVNQSTPASILFSVAQITIPIPGAASTDGITLDDLNGDRLPEIVLSQFLTASSNIFILTNTSTLGNISMSAPATITIGGSVVNLRIGDLDMDGKPDMAATQILFGTVSIFRNTGSGSTISFAPPVAIATEERPWGLDIGDLDGDGKPDLIAASLTKPALTLLNNNSTPGNLSFQTSIKTTTFITRHIQIGDIDGDSKPDVAFTSIDDNNNGIISSKVSVFRNSACPQPTVTPEGPHAICTGFPLQLQSSVVPGTTYEWRKDGVVVKSGTDPFIDITLSGSYTVTALSESGSCSLISNGVSVTVGAGATTGTATPTNNGPICIGSMLNLSVNDVGATEYRWTGPEGYTATGLTPPGIPNFQTAQGGRYNLDVIVGTCIAQQVSTVVESVPVPEFVINSGTSDVICAPDTKTLTVSPNLPSFSYQWFEETTGAIAGQTSTTLTVSSSGSYYAQASYTPNPSCATVETDAVLITFATAPVADFAPPATACMGQNVTFTNTSIIDPDVTITYQWEFGDGNTSTDEDPVHLFLSASTFTVRLTASYSNGACADDVTKNITVQSAPVVTITNPDNMFVVCPGDSLELETSGTFTAYDWSTNETTASIFVYEAGSYSVDVTTSSGCIINATGEVTAFDEPVVTVTADPPTLNEGETTQLIASGLVEYLWEPAETLSSATISDPIASPLVTTTYTVTGQDGNGCAGEFSIEIIVNEGSIYPKLTPSKFFSPNNGDDIGNVWQVVRINEFQCGVKIYDEKGAEVYTTDRYENTWDGTFKGKPVPDGVYYFIIKCQGDASPPKTGSITILR